MPLEFLLRRGDAWETAIDDTSFSMAMTIRRRLFGQLHGYSGAFHSRETRLDRLRFSSSAGMAISGRGSHAALRARSSSMSGAGGQGPQIQTIPAIVLARKAARGELHFKGATACIGLVTLDNYLEELEPYPVEMFSEPPTWIAGKGCFILEGCEQAPEPVSSRY